MIGLKQKKVLKVYNDHVGNQEAEINQLISILSDYRKKFGDIGMADSIVNQRADIERELQQVRQENQKVQLQLSTKEKDRSDQENVFKEMDNALQKLTSLIITKELSNLQSDVLKLETTHDELEVKIKVIEDELNELLSTKSKVL